MRCPSSDVAKAQALSNAASAHKTFLDEKGAMFELVCRCLKDAQACEKMMLGDLDFIRAGEWRELKLVLTGHLPTTTRRTAAVETTALFLV